MASDAAAVGADVGTSNNRHFCYSCRLAVVATALDILYCDVAGQ